MAIDQRRLRQRGPFLLLVAALLLLFVILVWP